MQSIYGSRMSSPTARRRAWLVVPTLLLLIAVATLGFVTSGCDATTGIFTETYTDDDFGFSFEYPSAWEIDSLVPGLSDYFSKSVGAFDPDGTAVDDYGYDQVAVEVYELIESEEFTLDDLEVEFRAWLDGAAQVDDSFAIVDPIVATTVGGLQGFKATMIYEQDGIDMRSTEYWLLGDGLVYNLYTDSSQDNWDGNQGIMEKFITTFTP